MATSIALTDSTSVLHTFAPIGPNTYKNRNGVTSAGDEVLVLQYSESTKNRPTNRVQVDLALPLERLVAGVNVAPDTARFTGQFVLPNSMTDVEREELLSLVTAAFSNVTIKAYVADLQPDYT